MTTIRNRSVLSLVVSAMLLLSISFIGVAAPKPTTMIGAFDIGPMGHPEGTPYYCTAGHTWLMKIWSPLVSWNDDFSEIVPQLATNWTANTEATEWTFELRQGVKWHDGQPFTAEDIKFTWELAFHPMSGSGPLFTQIASYLKGYEEYANGEASGLSGIEVLDDYTIRFEMVSPTPRFPSTLSGCYILPKHVFKDVKPEDLKTTDWWGTKAVGTGPYKVSKHVHGQYMEAVANPDYWRGAPKIDRLINRYFADQSAAELALERGEIDFTFIETDSAVRLSKDDRFTVFSGPSGVTNYLIFNHRNPIFADKRVRQAFLYAIDRETIVKQVFKGGATVVPCLAPYPALWPSEEDAIDYSYNPEKAKELLAEANWDPNYKFEVWTYYDSQVHKDVLQAIQAYLANVGVQMIPRFMDVPAYNSQFYTGKGWDVSYRGLACNTAAYPFTHYLSYGYPAAEGASLSGHKNDRFDGLMEAADVELDHDKYLELLREVGLYQNEQALDAYLWTAARYSAANTRVKNFTWYPAPGHFAYEDNVHLWEIDE